VHEPDPAAPAEPAYASTGRVPGDALEWSWPPYAPVPPAGEPFDTDEWAPPTVVRRPLFRLGRWTLVYRR
jgi:hypothetical protein